jgi:hypothetical protein
MLGFWKAKRADVIDHWYTLVPGFHTSTKEFYEGVEKALKAREIPDMEMSHVEFAEGGALSRQREYLRMSRERLVFDICAAQFGSASFFSCRFAEIPAVIKLWQLAAVFLVGLIITFLVLKYLGVFFGALVLMGSLVLLIYTLRNAMAMGLKNLDATLIKAPIVGPIYENWIRKETYYRQDTRLMYLDTVNSVIKARVEEATGAKGIKLVRYMENCPILNELYKPNLVPLPKEP